MSNLLLLSGVNLADIDLSDKFIFFISTKDNKTRFQIKSMSRGTWFAISETSQTFDADYGNIRVSFHLITKMESFETAFSMTFGSETTTIRKANLIKSNTLFEVFNYG